MKQKVLVILGPTATGKSDLALRLAKKFNGELVACDSRQVYKGLDIGTGKEATSLSFPRKRESIEMDPRSGSGVTKHDGYWIIDGIKVHMYDVVDPNTRHTLKDYVVQSTKIIEGILSSGKLPIIVGGTGLYLKGLLEGFSNLDIPVDAKIREGLERLSLEELQERLKKEDLKKFERLNNSEKKNLRRLIRHLELIYMYPYRNNLQFPMNNAQKWDVLKIGLTAPRTVLNQRIDKRVYKWVDEGFVNEGQRLKDMALPFSRFHELGLEYSVLSDYLDGKVSYDQMIEKMKIKTHQYAKRQQTWFKKEREVNWFDITTEDFSDKVESKVQSWYDVGASYDKTS